MTTYVLVSGAWHGAWWWYKVIPLLEEAGHRAIAVELPGHGRDWTAPNQISLQSYVDRVCETLDAQPEPVILVGHSRAGIVISQTAESRPSRIRTLVYLSAYLIPNGEALFPTARADTESLVGRYLMVDPERGYHMLKPEGFKTGLYADCSAEDLTLASALLTPEPLAPLGTPLNLSDENFGRVPRVYIETLQDCCVSLTLQRRMYTALPCRKVISMDTSHSPFLSAPQELVHHLTSLQ